MTKKTPSVGTKIVPTEFSTGGIFPPVDFFIRQETAITLPEKIKLHLDKFK